MTVIPIDIEGHTEEFEGSESDTTWPSFTNDPALNSGSAALNASPGDWIIFNHGTEYVYSFTDPQTGSSLITFTFGAINNGDGTFTTAPTQGASVSSPPATPNGGTSSTTATSYAGPYAAIAPSSSYDIEQLEEQGIVDIEVVANIDYNIDPATNKYPIHMHVGPQEVYGGHIVDNSVSKAQVHHGHWHTGGFIDTVIATSTDSSSNTNLDLHTPGDSTASGVGPSYIHDRTSGSLSIAPTGWTTTNPTVLTSVAAGSIICIELYDANGAPYGTGKISAYNGTSLTSARWYSLPSSTDLGLDQYHTLIKIGHMGNTKDSSGAYTFHPASASLTGITSSPNNVPGIGGPGSSTRETDYPHKPHKYHFNGFHFEFDKAIVDDAHRYAYGQTHGYSSTIYIVTETSEGQNEVASVTYHTTDTSYTTALVNNTSFMIRENYYVVWNASTSDITLTNNWTAENSTGFSGTSATGNAASSTIGHGKFAAVHWPPTHKDLYVIGQISGTPQKGYLYLRGWHHGNHINPDDIPNNVFTRENDYPASNDRWHLRDCHIEVGLAGAGPNFDSSLKIVTDNTLYRMEIHDAELLNRDGTVDTTYKNKIYGSSDTSIVNDATVGNIAAVEIDIPSGGRSCTVRAGWYVVFNMSGSSVTLSKNYRIDNTTSVGSHQVECIRYPPNSHPQLIVLGHMSYKPDAKGYLYLVGSKHGVGLTGPTQVGSGNTSEEEDRPKRAYNWTLDNFHLEFSAPAANVSTVTLVFDPGTSGNKNITFKDTATTKQVSNSTFSAKPSYNVYFNKSSSSIASGGVTPSGNTMPSFFTGENLGAIASLDMRAVSVVLNDPDLVHIGIVSPGADTSGFYFLKGWQHHITTMSSDFLKDKSLASEKLNPSNPTRWMLKGVTMQHSGSTPFAEPQKLVWGDYPTAPLIPPTGLEGQALAADGGGIGVNGGNIQNNFINIKRGDLIVWNSSSVPVTINVTTVNAGDIGAFPEGSPVNLSQLFWIGKVKKDYDSKSGLLTIEGFHVGLHQVGGDSLHPGSATNPILHPSTAGKFILHGVTITHTGPTTVTWTSGNVHLLDGSTPPGSASGVVNSNSGTTISANQWVWWDSNDAAIHFGTSLPTNSSSYTNADVSIYPIGKVSSAPDSKSGCYWIQGFKVGLHQIGGNGIQDGAVGRDQLNDHNAAQYHYQNIVFDFLAPGTAQPLTWTSGGVQSVSSGTALTITGGSSVDNCYPGNHIVFNSTPSAIGNIGAHGFGPIGSVPTNDNLWYVGQVDDPDDTTGYMYIQGHHHGPHKNHGKHVAPGAITDGVVKKNTNSSWLSATFNTTASNQWHTVTPGSGSVSSSDGPGNVSLPGNMTSNNGHGVIYWRVVGSLTGNSPWGMLKPISLELNGIDFATGNGNVNGALVQTSGLHTGASSDGYSLYVIPIEFRAFSDDTINLKWSVVYAPSGYTTQSYYVEVRWSSTMSQT